MTCRDCIHWFVCSSSGGTIYDNEQRMREDCSSFMRASNTVEVVRCKDCIENCVYPDGILRCRRTGRNMSAENYCSYGERSDNDTRTSKGTS